MTSNQILIYHNENGEPSIEVKFDKESIWLSQKQLGELFDKDSDTIGLHIKNIYKSGELTKELTTEKYSVVQIEGNREVKRNINFYNLDVIISVGYRVNSKKGTQFRIWANNVLKNFLIEGYSINEKRLNQLKKTIQIVSRTAKNSAYFDKNMDGFFDVLSDYTKALDLLDNYDHQKIDKTVSQAEVIFKINYDTAISAINALRQKFGASVLFGNEKDESFKSSIAVIDQTFAGKDLYPSIEEKAANLLYLVVKNHSFTDGNKRIAAWLFVWYLNKNSVLYKQNGRKKISNNTLVTLTLMIADSNPKEKELLINVITNLIHTEDE